MAAALHFVMKHYDALLSQTEHSGQLNSFSVQGPGVTQGIAEDSGPMGSRVMVQGNPQDASSPSLIVLS